MNHGQINHRLAAVGQSLVILAQPTVAAKPAKGAFHNPSLGQDDEALDVVATFDDLQQPAAKVLDPADQLPGIAAVGPDQLQPRQPADQLGQYQLGPVAVLEVGRVD